MSETDIQSNQVVGNQLHKVLLSALSSLSQQNLAAFNILISKVNEGFFDTRQTQRPLNTLADQLLETIKSGGEENAD